MVGAAERKADDDTAEWRISMASRVDSLDIAIRANTLMTSEIKKNTDDIVEFFEAGRGTFKFLKMVGTAAKWLTTVTAAAALIWFAIKGVK